jgi:transmembrane sensor
MTDATRLAQLIVNRLLGTISASEEAELDAWLDESPENLAFMENEIRPVVLAQDLEILAEMDEEALDEKTWAEIEQAITKEPTVPHTPRKQNKTLQLIAFPAAAIFILLIIKTYLWPALPEFSRTYGEIWQSQSSGMTKPVQRPMLTISKDAVLYLDTLPEGKMASLGKWLILKVSRQHIAYVLMDKKKGATPMADSGYNVISLPPGTGVWQITLPDRSRVFLDQGSSLSFSVHPAGIKPPLRLVALNGQAFFEVSHDSQSPFILETNKGEIKVRGTSFSIRDYQKEPTAVILQYAGKLEISNGNRSKFLDSAQRATIDPAIADISVDKNVNLPPHPFAQFETFDFSQQNLISALNEVAKYYRIPKIHVDQRLDTTTPGKLRMGKVPKDLPLNQLLAQLEQNDMHFKATEEMITVTK